MEDLQSLYNKLQAGNIEVPDFNTFKSKYGSDTGMTTLHGKLQAGNIEVPDLSTFKSKYLSTPATQTPTPQQEAPVSQTPAPKQKSNVEAPKFVAPTKIAPVNPKTIKPSTTPAFNKQKLIENEADLEVNLQKQVDDINKEYNNKIRNFASSSVMQDAYMSPKLSGTLKIGDKTFTVGSNPQVNAISLEKERVKKVDQILVKDAAQRGQLVLGDKQKKLKEANNYAQVKINDELAKLQEDRKYFSDLLSEKNLLPESPSFVSSFGAPVKSRTGRGIKPEILAELGIETTGNPYKDYDLVKQKVNSEISNIDNNIAENTRKKGISKTQEKYLDLGVDYAGNLRNFNLSNVVNVASKFKPKIAEREKEISGEVGEITSTYIPNPDVEVFPILNELARYLPSGIGTVATLLSGSYNLFKEPFIKKIEYKNLSPEKKQLLNYDDAAKTVNDLIELNLEQPYDELTSKYTISKEDVKKIALGMLNLPTLKANETLQAPEGIDQSKFNGLIVDPQFLEIKDKYANTSSEFDIEGKKQRLSLAEANKITALKAREFGTISKLEKDAEIAQVSEDFINKKSKDASILSEDFFRRQIYGAAYNLTRAKAATQDIAGGVLKVGSTIYEDQFKGEVSGLAKSNINELLKSTDLYDVLVPTNSALQLSLFNTNKFITIKDQDGKNISLEIDAMDDIKNVHAEEFAYVVRDPKQKQAIIDFYNKNKEELLKTATTLSNTDGGKRAIFENTYTNVKKELIDEVPTLAFEFTAGAGVAPFVVNSERLKKLSQYGIAAASNMLETYPMIYKGYEENIDDPDNPYAAMLTTGGLGAVSLLTSGLDRKLIGLGQNAVSKEIMPNVIKNSAPIIKAISKETLKITDKNLREATFKSAVSKAMIQEAMAAMKPAFKTALSKGKEMGVETLGEVGEEIGTEPITQYVANFLNAAILDNQAYKQQTLNDLNFLDPETAWLTFWTAGAISSGANIAQSIQNNNPYTQVDYLKAALKKPDEVMKMLDNIAEDNSPEVIQKVKDDYNALKTSYEEKKKDLNISQDLLESMDFQNPAVQIVMGKAGINKAVVDNIRGTKNYDALLIQQVLEEKKAKDLEAEIQDGVSQGLIVEAEGGYKAGGNNPLSKPYEKTIADFEKTNNNIQYFNNFITEFNNKTAPIQRQFVNELQKSLVVAPDLYDVKQENEDSSSLYYDVNDFNTLRTNTLSKLVNEARLIEVNNEISSRKSDDQDVEQLQAEKKQITQAIKESTDAINLIQQQYKPGRTETNEQLKQTIETSKIAQIELATALDAVSRIQDAELDLDNHEINDIYEKYNQTVRDRNQVASKLKKEYKVDIPMQPEITPEQFNQVKETITRKYNLGKTLESGKGNLSDLNEFVNLSESLGTITEDDTLQEPESSEDIDDIVNNPKQLSLQAKAMNLSPLLSALNVKKRVSSKLHAQLNEAEQEKTLGINEILSTKIDQTSGQNTTYVIDGKEYTIANRPNSNTTVISEQQKSQVVLDELVREVARRIFSESMDLSPNIVETIMNKAISESYPELALELDENSLRLISANIAKLKMELENQGFNILFNDKVISSVFATPSESDNAIVGIASKIPLIAVSPEGNIHLINFKLFTGSTSDNLGIFNEEMTIVESLFKDNDVNITGIHMLPIKVKTTLEDNILNVEKFSLDFRETENPVSPSLIQLQTDVALEDAILTNLGTNAVEEAVEEVVSPTEVALTSSETPILRDVESMAKQELDADKLNKEAGVDIYVARQEVESGGNNYYLSQIKENNATNTFLIEDVNGNEIGKAQLSKDGNFLENIRIDEKHRRKGLASKVYDFIELRKGIELEPSPNKQSKEAKALWDKRNLQKSVSNKANGGLIAKALGESMSKAFSDFRKKQEVLVELENRYFKQKGLSKEDFNKLSETEKSEIIKDAVKWKNENPELVKAVESLLSKDKTPTASVESTAKALETLDNETPIIKTQKTLTTKGLADLDIVQSKESSSALESEIGGDKGGIDNKVRTIPIQEYDVTENNRSRQIAEQIEENGWIEPLIVSYDKNGNVYIVEGQHRAAALKQLGYDKAPVIVIYDKSSNIGKAVESLLSKEQPQAIVQPEIETPITPEDEGVDTDSEEVEPVSTSPTYNVGGTANGVYITVAEKKLANGSVIYKIQIENDPDLNAEYKNKNFKSEGEVKAEYAKKGWFVPEKIITNTAYSLQDSEGNSIKSPISPITSDKINNLSFVSEGRGQEITIEEQDETMNDDASIQSNFANKANLVIKSGDEIIAVVPFNSPIRRKLQTITVDGKMRLAPTTAKINKVIQKDFDRTAPVTLGNWFLDFVNANGAYTYDVGYVQYDNKKETFVLKNTEGKTIFIYSPEKQPTLGATYLIAKDENGKETRFALQTPKLRDVVLNDGSKPTREEIINLMQKIPNKFKTGSEIELYTNIINGLRIVIAESKNPRIIEIADLLAKELGAKDTIGRAESTTEQLATLDYLPAYSPETKKEIEETVADFFLNRIITLTENSIPKHIITTNPNTVFLDNTLEVNDLVSGNYSEEVVKLQGLSDADFLDLVTSKGMVQINPDCL
jgi:hypothetical protein